MIKFRVALLFVIALAAPLFSSNANAVVVTYSITFNDPDGAGALTGGSGLMTLDVANLPGPFFYGAGNPNFLGLTATINGQNYVVTANDITGGINVGAQGQFYDLGVKSPAGSTPGSHSFEMYGAQGYAGYNVFTVNGPNLISGGTWSIGAPVVQVAAAVPEASTWAMMILGFAAVGFTAYRRRNSKLSLRIA